jgi:hypothetical protein
MVLLVRLGFNAPNESTTAPLLLVCCIVTSSALQVRE